MKNLVYGSLFLALVGIMFTGCKKDMVNLKDGQSSSILQSESNSQTKPKSKGIGQDKSEPTSLDSLAQAASIKSIVYNEQHNIYVVSTYLNSTTYSVTVDSLNPKAFVKMSVTPSQGSSFSFKVKVSDSVVDITGGYGEYSFSDYEETGVSTNEPFVKNLVAVISAYCLVNPEASAYYENNGHGDTFPPAGMRRKFIGYTTTTMPCDPILHYGNVYHEFHFFWIHWSGGDYTTQYGC